MRKTFAACTTRHPMAPVTDRCVAGNGLCRGLAKHALDAGPFTKARDEYGSE
jgi:hypothetical protein